VGGAAQDHGAVIRECLLRAEPLRFLEGLVLAGPDDERRLVRDLRQSVGYVGEEFMRGEDLARLSRSGLEQVPESCAVLAAGRSGRQDRPAVGGW
jgi:hypothetical protein